MSLANLEKGQVETIHSQQTLGTVIKPTSRPRIANPATLGLFSFSTTTLILSLYNIGVRGIHHPNVLVGMGLFCGGLTQLLAGMWEFPKGNTFGAAVFTSYGGFWMAYATTLIPGSGIAAAYADDESELQSALGIFLVCWLLVSFFFFIATLGKNIAFMLAFGVLTLTFACLAGGELGGSAVATKAGGVFGVIIALIGYYIGIAELLESEAHPPFRLPLGHLHRKD